MSEVIRSERGQAVLISLRNGPEDSRGQNAGPVQGLGSRFEWRRPSRQRNGRNAGQMCGMIFAGRRQIGALAQLGEHLLCKQRVIGSIPIGSTK